MKKKDDSLFKTLQYILFVCVIIFGFITIVGTGGGGGGGGDVPYDDPSADSDGDGITNYLEVNGYTYDYLTGTYSLWNGDVSVEYFKSDPLQWSTDGDPYSDSMEVSGLDMDRSVLAPGEHPMIPAYPNLIVKLIGYDVTLDATITETDGTEHREGSNWSASTTETNSTTDEWHWEVSQEVSCSFLDFGASTSVSYGESHSETYSYGTTKSNGGDIMDSTQWSLATCSNPSQAARIKLTLQVENVGTCVAKNVALTMNLGISGKSVRTIYTDVANPISTLEVGETHEFVEADIPLTYDELRSLETGASVTLEVTEVVAEVVRKEGDQWESIGTWDDYMREARAICAHLFLDLGDGNTTEHLVYAHDSESAPEVILKDAIIWAANGQDDPVLGPVVSFYQTDGSLGPAKPLDGWYFSLDATTYESISDYIQNPDFNLFDTVLGPNSIIVAKAPPIEDWPKIHWAILSPRHGKVAAYVDDYFFSQSLLEVYFVDKDGEWHLMTWNEEALYYAWSCPMDYFRDSTEKIVARNLMYDPEDPDTWKWQTEMAASEMGYVPGWKNLYLAGSYDTPGNSQGVFVSDNYAYVADGFEGLAVIDVSDPANPTYTGSCDTPGHAWGVFVSGNYAYVADWGSGLQVIDVDSTSPNYLTIIATYDTPGNSEEVFVSGNYAYVADDGLQVIDVSNPAKPALVGSCDTPGTPIGLFVSGNYAYVADYNSGLQVIDVDSTSLNYLTIIATYDTPGTASEVFVSGNYAYVADWASGLQVIDVSNPATPTYEGSYDTPGDAYGVFVSGSHAYVADDESGLQVIDISNPASPSWLCSYTPGHAYGVFVSGNYAYVADYDSGLQVFGYK